MDKKRISLLILSLITCSSMIPNFVFATPICNVFNLKTDKSFYYYYESINVSATWETDYSSGEEIYVQLKLFDIYENLKWNSSQYNETGFLTRNWTIGIQSLNLSMIDNPTILSLRFYRHYRNFVTSENNSIYLESLNVSVANNNVICELNDFKSNLTYGDDLQFNASFYYLSNNSKLTNQQIGFLIESESNVNFQQNLTTNDNGTVTINLSTLRNLSIGENTLIFEIINPKFINNSIFHYALFVSKSKIYIDIIEFYNKIYLNEFIIVKLKFYYLNYTIYPLMDENIILSIYQNNTLKVELLFTTNSTGHLNAFINPSDFKFSRIEEAFSIVVEYNGSDFLDNASVSLQLVVSDHNKNEFDPSVNIIILSSSVLTITATMFFLINYNKKRERSMKLKDLTFKF